MAPKGNQAEASLGNGKTTSGKASEGLINSFRFLLWKSI